MKSTSAARMRKYIRESIALSAMIVTATFFVEGCSSVQNMSSSSSVDPGTNACPAGIGGEPTACCDSSGTPLATPPSGVSCTEAVPGQGPITYHVGQGAASAGGSAGESGSASSLVGGQKSNGTQYSGATAGSIPVTTAQSATSPNSITGSSLGTPGTGSTGTTGPTTSGSALAGMGDIMTAPASSPSPGASNGANTSGLTAAAGYGTSGGSGMLPNGAKETGFHFGNGLTGSGALDASGAHGGEMKFADGTNAMSSNDPSDYFTRIGIEDSIFKKVEKRYRSTAENWTSASLSAPISTRVRSSVRSTASQGSAK